LLAFKEDGDLALISLLISNPGTFKLLGEGPLLELELFDLKENNFIF
jgi:hypothetical protein